MYGPKTGIVVFLCDNFDELLVATLCVHYRQAGSLVKIIAQTSKGVRGAHGLILTPDTTLNRLARTKFQAKMMIWPNNKTYLERLENDPDFRKLLIKICTLDTKLVVSNEAMEYFLHLPFVGSVVTTEEILVPTFSYYSVGGVRVP
jgi:hypothetical protein